MMKRFVFVFAVAALSLMFASVSTQAGSDVLNSSDVVLSKKAMDGVSVKTLSLGTTHDKGGHFGTAFDSIANIASDGAIQNDGVLNTAFPNIPAHTIELWLGRTHSENVPNAIMTGGSSSP